MSELAERIIAALEEHPDDWKEGQSKITYRGVSLWIGTGMLGLHVHSPREATFHLLDKWRIWLALRKQSHAIINRVLESVSKSRAVLDE